jgi:hypothetical protein
MVEPAIGWLAITFLVEIHDVSELPALRLSLRCAYRA